MRKANLAGMFPRRATTLSVAAVAMAVLTFAAVGSAAAAQSCDDFDECTIMDTCQADGTCKGTPKENGTPCDDGSSCTTDDRCLDGRCVGSMTQEGAPCTSALGACMTDSTCHFGFCLGNIVQCPDTDGNKCTIDVCDPRSGQCITVTNTCSAPCSSGQCDPGTGECVNMQPINEGQSCDDGNVCTGNDQCHAGDCTGTAGVFDTPTPVTPPTVTPTATANIDHTPTATATLAPTSTPSLGPCIGDCTPTATATLAPTSTPSLGPCIGDCSGDGAVTVDELIKGVNIALGNAEVGVCPSFDVNGDGMVTIDEIIQGVRAALAGCEIAPPTATPSLLPTDTPVPTATATMLPATATSAPSTDTPTPVFTATMLPSQTPANSSTPTDTFAPTATPIASATSTSVSTLVPTPTETATATATDTVPVETPTDTPTATDTPAAELTPTETPTPEASATPTETATLGPPNIPRRAAGAIESTTAAFLVIPNVLSVVLGHTPGAMNNAQALTFPPIPFTCPGGGGGSISCSQNVTPLPPFLGAPMYTITITGCVVDGTNSETLTFNGTVNATGQSGEACGTIPANVTVAVPQLTVATMGTAGTTTATFTNITGALALSCSGATCDCNYDTATIHLSGGISVTSKNPMGEPRSSTQATFSNDDITITVQQYGQQCVPVIYSMEVDGDVMLSTDGHSFGATLVNYTLDDDATSGSDMIEVSGEVTSGCFGATVDLETLTSLSLAAGNPCPMAGEVQVTAGENTDLVRYTADGGVEIDLGDDGSVDESFASCLDPRLAECPAT